jgi:hypothetical protein
LTFHIAGELLLFTWNTLFGLSAEALHNFLFITWLADVLVTLLLAVVFAAT